MKIIKLGFNRKTILILLAFLGLWIAIDLYVPRSANLRQFDPVEVGKLDVDMWRSYYEKKQIKLFWQLSKLMREQFHAPFWRSFRIGYHAAKAAFVFKKGKNRADYAKALPDLEKYYADINALNNKPFDVQLMTQQELEWWIIRREPQHSQAEWEQLLAQTTAIFYNESPEKFRDYARLRVEAMFFRDEKGDRITEVDWQKINALCIQSWQAVQTGLQQ
jgi:hypothetical protein